MNDLRNHFMSTPIATPVFRSTFDTQVKHVRAAACSVDILICLDKISMGLTSWRGSVSMKARSTFVLYQVPSLSSQSISYHPGANLHHTGLISAVDATMEVANKVSVYSRTTNGKMQVVDLFAGGMFTVRIHY
ncbi:hypothetical protein I315_05880 [Cryptococcus gattii Ru294]|nr:hypothetical protein I315_05880 [Cryptococcus gattii Ru294]